MNLLHFYVFFGVSFFTNYSNSHNKILHTSAHTITIEFLSQVEGKTFPSRLLGSDKEDFNNNAIIALENQLINNKGVNDVTSLLSLIKFDQPTSTYRCVEDLQAKRKIVVGIVDAWQLATENKILALMEQGRTVNDNGRKVILSCFIIALMVFGMLMVYACKMTIL
jgi:hypothetical protein